MSKTKSYTLLSGKFRQGGEVYKPGDTVELTEAQAKAFADAIQPADAEAKAEPTVTGTKQMNLSKQKVAAVEPEEEDDGEGEEDTGEVTDESEVKAPVAPVAKPVASKPAATSKPVAKQASK